jgi:NAD(P)-dependent dehydrogenase (short-subunit alcohol dehydrogenase family)
MATRLLERTALVTGSTNGIGESVARALAAEGAQVIISGRDTEKGHTVVADIVASGGRADFVAVDLAHGSPAVQELARAALAAGGGSLDILVNNAALLINPSPTAEVSEALIDRAMDVNIKAAFLLTGLLAPPMASRGRGAVINIGSINGLIGMGGSALYSMTKTAIHSLTRSWAAEYGPSGVRVNTVAPGPTITPNLASQIDDIEVRLAPILAAIPSGRFSTPAEIAAAVVFLASDEASNIHGATLSVDGGRAAV